ncbi:hypothetical protein CCUS01_01069 [Colletotrichum cuscutae]|uniref:TNFR-Cys domain-containing protein n=1 Tax=Colletotrichum cuscutae TaxID=1209917 RepID=A0AAI9UX92_9PEZI|nr:hypothetical protein CCUS01_01069 [Colletotrichum cuscutae]
MIIPKFTTIWLFIAIAIASKGISAQELFQHAASTNELPALCSVLCLPLKLVFPNCDTLCQTCERPKTFCKTGKTAECVDTSTDVGNCGKCGTKASHPRHEARLADGTTCCNSECLPNDTFQSDPMNCGKCGNKCPENYNCHSGHCLEPHTCKAGVSLLESCQGPVVSGSSCGAGEDELCDCMEPVEGDPFCGAFDGQYCQDMCNSDEDCQNSKGKKCARRDKTCCSAVATDDKSHKTFKGILLTVIHSYTYTTTYTHATATMKLPITLAILLAPMAVFAKPPKRTSARHVRIDRLPTCIQYCIGETQWRIKGATLPKLAGEWCAKTAAHTPDWISFGKALDECKKHQCDNSIQWIDLAVWHWDMCEWSDVKEEGMNFLNGYRKAYWLPNDRQPIRPPHSRNWISDETFEAPDEWNENNGIGDDIPEDQPPLHG